MPPASLLLEQSVRDSLREGRSVTLIAFGNSMFPTLVPGTQLRLTPDSSRLPRLGDLAVVERPDGGVAVHRVVLINEQHHILTWGDALPEPDAWGYSPVLAWPKILHSPWHPSLWSRWKGALRVRYHLASTVLFRHRTYLWNGLFLAVFLFILKILI